LISIKEQNRYYKEKIRRLDKEEKRFENKNDVKSKFILKIIRTMRRHCRQLILQTSNLG
jgi:hypothetical protein